MFGAIKITKDVNTSQCQYSGFGFYFDSGDEFSIGNINNGKNVIIFGADMSFSRYLSYQLNSIHVLGKGTVQGISTTGHTTIYAEKCYKKDLLNKIKNLY